MIKRLVFWILKSKMFNYLLKNILPYVRLTTYYTDFKGHKYHLGYARLKAGDIILTTDNKKLTSFLIPGSLDHAAFCIGKSSTLPEIIEMTHRDFTYSWFFDLCKESTRVIILRNESWTPEYIESMIRFSDKLRKVKYDNEFKLGIDYLYCFELIYVLDYARTLGLDQEDLIGLGRPYISGRAIFENKNLKVIYDSDQF